MITQPTPVPIKDRPVPLSLILLPLAKPYRETPAFSCGARSASKLKETGYLRNMLSRRQLQGFVMRAAFF